MQDFRQRTFEPRVLLSTYMPHIYIAHKAMEKIFYMVKIAKKEVGWFGIVSFNLEFNVFNIEDVFLLEQSVGDTTHNIAANALGDLAQQLMVQYPGEKGTELCGKLLFWGHSHVNMPARPSVQDNIQIKEWENNDVPFMIRGIFNKKGDVHFTIFFYDNQVVVEDVPWSMVRTYNEATETNLVAEFATKVKEIKEFHSRKWYMRAIKKAELKKDAKLLTELREEFAAFEEQERLEIFEENKIIQAAPQEV